MATTSSAEEGRTMVAPPPPAPPAPPSKSPADKTRMTPSGRFVMPDLDEPPTATVPVQKPAPRAERTSALDLLAEVDAAAAELGIGQDDPDEDVTGARDERDLRAPPRRRPEIDEDFAPGASTTKNDPRRGPKRRGPSLAIRLLSWAAFLATAAVLGVASLMYTGTIANPFAAPVIEVFANVETAAVSIDGNVVLASGRAGRWPVGPGSRVIEVTARGYKPFMQVVDVAKGDVAIVDALLEPAADAIAEIEVRSVPPGATAWIGEELLGTTPVILKKPLGKYEVRVTRDRYEELAVPIALTRPGVSATGIDVSLVPAIASIRVSTTPTGAEISVDGTARGKSPVTVDGLSPGQPVIVQAVRKGFRTESRTVTPAGGVEITPVDVALEPTTAAVTAKPTPGAAPAPSPGATPAATPSRAIPANMGLLSVEVAGGWGEVYLDGVRLATRTPLEGAEIAPGQHQLRVVNPQTGSERTMTVDITAGKETRQRLTLD